MNCVKAVVLAIFALFSAEVFSEIEPLEPDEGYVVIALYSKGYSESIVLEGTGLMDKYNFGPLNYSQHIEVMKMPAGNYSWNEVYERSGSLQQNNLLKVYYDLSDNNLNFTVKPGVLNYTGLLMIERLGRQLQVRQLNRASIILKILEQDHPGYIENFEVVNGLYPNDHYIDFYLTHSSKEGE
jgi:hypothetical protein